MSAILPRILGERLAIVGTTGSGKSYTARGLVERILGPIAAPTGRVGIIDPTGVWWGLRLRADGKTPGYPVVLFGGDRSDVPLVETAGRVIAQAVASTHQSWIVDTSALGTKAAERRFMLDFLDSLFEHNREEITLVVDEADRFSPQRMTPETARLHERMEEIVRRGRVRGFTPVLITQRPASLNKDVLSQASGLIAMKLTGVHDRDAVAAVIEGQADRAQAREIVNQLPAKQRGEGIVWAPALDILDAVAFPKILTFDSMAAPKRGEARNATPLPPIDLGALRDKMAAVVAETEADKPTKLKAEIKRLERALEVALAAKGPNTAELSAAETRGRAEGYQTARDEMRSFLGSNGAAPAIVAARPAPVERAPVAAPAPRVARPVGELHPAAVKMTAAMVAQNTPMTWNELCVVSGLIPGNGYFFSGKKSMVEAGFVADHGGMIEPTDAARKAVGPARNALAPEEIVAMWRAKLTEPAPKMLAYIAEHSDRVVTQDELSKATATKPGNGYWYKGIKALRVAGLVEQSGGAYQAASILR